MAARKKVKRPARGAGKGRVRKIMSALEAMIEGDLERQLPISRAQDELDSLCYSVNILVGELAFATANLRRARAEAEAANAAKSSFLRAASHELRTPLAVIVWLAELLKDPARVPPDRFARSLAGIRSSADELLRTTEAVLNLSRLDQPNSEPEQEVIHLPATIREALENLQPLAERKQLGLRLAMMPGAPTNMTTNGQHVRQVIVNLVANAIKFSPAGTCVRTSVEARDEEALVSVADDGRGIPADQLEAVFERFQQVDASDRREKGGTGLGLAISRAIVDQHAGRIWAESEPGQGATFRFTLPLSRAAGTVAVYDRRAAGRDELARAVRRHGRRVVIFESPEALAASSERFVAVVTDAELDADPGVPVLRSGALGELPG